MGNCLRPHEAIIHPRFQSPEIEIVKVAAEGGISIPLLEILILLRLEYFSKDIPGASKGDQDHVAQVGRQEVEVGWFVHDVFGQRATHVLGHMAMIRTANGTKLGMDRFF